ncbi:MAG: hypothetical protein KC481_20630 [Acidimicrobiaceae bacterium]|jgi:hypothetical protein|nr:hypothetical protein [Acidimicrobiaceae bacterium]MCO4836065.1 hypothetical protein [Acidimicrobiaceae bacterium]MDB4103672.1 hypothetical protein [Acidimicrobiales bacterium]MDC1389960.1 hypothetical protein [Acidimicrobiales bacterium]HAY69153.1 hypothetical protein [Acidimicrobiaceae bacterium]
MTEITPDDLQKKFGQLKDELENVAGAARSTAQKVGVVAGVLLVLLAFFLGSKRGKAGKTIVEVRRL